MALELMDMLVQFLCPTSNAASQCQSFISSHSGIAPPFGAYIYFLFFPTVFLLLFLWIVFKDAIKANKGISLIASIAVYVFIIIQGLYPIFLALGELWIVFIFLLGFFYLIIRRFRSDKGGGGKGGKMPGLMGGGMSATRALNKLKGGEKTQAEMIKAEIDLFAAMDANAKDVSVVSERIAAQLRAFGSETSVFGKPVASEYHELYKYYKETCRTKGVKPK